MIKNKNYVKGFVAKLKN